jgi:hypothetical protein
MRSSFLLKVIQIVTVLGVVCTALGGCPQSALAEPAAGVPGGAAFRLISQTGGGTYASTVNGDYLYMGVGPRLVIFDIKTNPKQPAKIFESDVLPSAISAIEIQGAYAYLADDDGGLVIFDIRTPANAKMLSSLATDGYCWDVAISGTSAYIADVYAGLTVIDVSDPLQPKHSTRSIATYQPRVVQIFGSYLYLADDKNGAKGLRILDIHDPQAISEVKYITYPDAVRSITQDGNGHAYVIEQKTLHVLDVSTPSAAFEISHLALTGWMATEATYVAPYLYVAVDSSGLQVVNTSNPANLQIVDTLSGALGSLGTIITFAKGGSYLYSAWSSFPGIQVITLQNPAAPTFTSSVRFPAGPNYTVNIVDHYAFLTEASEEDLGSGLTVLDIADPQNPQYLSSFLGNGMVDDMVYASGKGYLAGEENGVIEVNLEDPASPGLLRTWTNSSVGWISDLDEEIRTVLFKPHVYIYALDTQKDTVYRLNVNDTANPIAVTGSHVMSVADDTCLVYDYRGYVFVGADNGSVTAVQVNESTGTFGSEVGKVAPGHGMVRQMAISGNYLYVASLNAGLEVIDIQNVNNMQVVGTYNVDNVESIEVSSPYAILYSSETGITALDISDPTHPAFVGAYGLLGDIGDMDIQLVNGKYQVSVAAGELGYYIFEFPEYQVHLPLVKRL